MFIFLEKKILENITLNNYELFENLNGRQLLEEITFSCFYHFLIDFKTKYAFKY